jgi:MFS family permease
MRPTADRQRAAFAFLYPLAVLGAHLAFMPLLLLLLPRRVSTLLPDMATSALSILLLAGGVTASLANIAAGRWSDRHIARSASRRMPIAVGLFCLVLSYGGLMKAGSLATLLAAMIAFQVALNIMFAPLGALLADYVADEAKGRMTGWLTAALPLSIAAAAGVAALWPLDSDVAFAAIPVAVIACVAPLLLFWPSVPLVVHHEDGGAAMAPLPFRDFRLAWAARLLVQCGAALVIHYLYVFLAALPQASAVPAPVSRASAILFALAAAAGGAATIAVGHASDRFARRRLPMTLSALAAAAGLLLLSLRPDWTIIVIAYGLFSAGLAAFLSVDSAMVATLLGSNAERGKWLGIMNLTNTLPAVLTPLLALAAVEFTAAHALSYLLVGASLAVLVAAVLVGRIRAVR